MMELRSSMARKEHEMAERINKEWSDLGKRDGLEAWADNEWSSMDCHDIADLVKDHNAANVIRTWKEERYRELNIRCKKRIVESANKILEVFPNKEAILNPFSAVTRAQTVQIFISDYQRTFAKQSLAATAAHRCVLIVQSTATAAHHCFL
jgi:hypothetical protein